MLVLIAAMGLNRVIGVDGGLPWHLPDDLKRFKAMTMGKPMIMGRATFESIGRPLPGRTNIVVTRNQFFSSEGVVVASSPAEAVAIARREVGPNGEIAVIGGGQIYRELFPEASRLELTVVDDAPEGDTTFPEFNRDDWTVTEETVPGSPAVAYRTYRRIARER